MRNTSAASELSWFRDGPLGLRNYRRQLGRSATLCTAQQRDVETLLFLGATQNRNVKGLDPRAEGDAAASLLQISCTYEGLNEANATRPLQVRGTIAWGTDGHQCVADFDWLNGTIVQVAASFVKVSARIVDNLAAAEVVPTHDPLAAVRVGATVGYWGAAKLAATFTTQVRLDSTAAPASAAIAIPRFARRLWINMQPPQTNLLSAANWAIGPAAAQEVAQLDNFGPAAIQSRAPYERPGYATHLSLTGTLAQNVLVTLVWELDL